MASIFARKVLPVLIKNCRAALPTISTLEILKCCLLAMLLCCQKSDSCRQEVTFIGIGSMQAQGQVKTSHPLFWAVNVHKCCFSMMVGGRKQKQMGTKNYFGLQKAILTSFYRGKKIMQYYFQSILQQSITFQIQCKLQTTLQPRAKSEVLSSFVYILIVFLYSFFLTLRQNLLAGLSHKRFPNSAQTQCIYFLQAQMVKLSRFQNVTRIHMCRVQRMK